MAGGKPNRTWDKASTLMFAGQPWSQRPPLPDHLVRGRPWRDLEQLYAVAEWVYGPPYGGTEYHQRATKFRVGKKTYVRLVRVLYDEGVRDGGWLKRFMLWAGIPVPFELDTLTQVSSAPVSMAGVLRPEGHATAVFPEHFDRSKQRMVRPKSEVLVYSVRGSQGFVIATGPLLVRAGPVMFQVHSTSQVARVTGVGRGVMVDRVSPYDEDVEWGRKPRPKRQSSNPGRFTKAPAVQPPPNARLEAFKSEATG